MISYCLLLFLLLNGFLSHAQCDTVDLALGKPAAASSLQSATFPASDAFDGDTTGTRWSSASSDPQTISVDMGSAFNLCGVTLFWEAALGKDFTIDISNDSISWTTVATVTGNVALKNVLSVTGSGRYVRMVGTARGTGFGYSLYEFQVFGFPSSCNTVNLALNQPVVVSSIQAGLPAPNAVDGDLSTRWGSDASDPQFIYVDLGGVHNICQVALYWEAAYAASYTINVSNDAVSWTTIYTVASNTARTNILNVTGSGRYVRMNGLTRGTTFGYSLFEFQVRDQVILPIKLAHFNGTNEGNQYSLLEWTTDIEVNNQYFDIERSLDGSHYTAIGRVAGAGNSVTPKEYQWRDSLPVKGVNYYRLKQVDLDGKSSYSNIVSVNIGAGPLTQVSVYPNPARDLVNIVVPQGVGIQEVGIYNSIGTEMKKYSGLSNGNNLQISVGSLSNGLYTLKIITNKGTEIIKLLK